MARIRKIEVSNFRTIRELEWLPKPGINCLIGPGDSGKSTLLDAIDLCLGARRTIQFTDADFYELNVENPIEIAITVGELAEELKNIDAYGLFLRGFNPDTGLVEDEPERDLETVLTLGLYVGSDLEPVWSLVSDRGSADGSTRTLSWGDRVRIAPTRIGAQPDYNLGWRRGSVLNLLTDEKADASAALAKAARDARNAFGTQAEAQLGETLKIVTDTAESLGVDIGGQAKALLDAHSVTFTGGTISLHNDDGVPLRSLGTGSTRLLVAGLQRHAAKASSLLLVDELEHGLEPHRIIRLIGALGSKETSPPLQVFMTSHSPVALRELAGDQLWVVRKLDEKHQVLLVGTDNDTQSAIRLYPEAFLAKSVIVSEGASEVGFVRGLDQYRCDQGETSISASGVCLIDCGGGGPNRPYQRAAAFHRLGYRVAVLRDDDQSPDKEIEEAFEAAGGEVFTWRSGQNIEDEIFSCLPDPQVTELIKYAVELHGVQRINEQIETASESSMTFRDVMRQGRGDGYNDQTRKILSAAATVRKAGWFKSVSWMEKVGRTVVGPALADCNAEFCEAVVRIFTWSEDDQK